MFLCSPIPIPAIERIYFHFAPAIDTSKYACDLTDAEACQDLYGEISAVHFLANSLADLINESACGVWA